MKQLVLGLILFGILCFGIGCLTGVMYENISLNEKIVQNLQHASEENKTIKLNEKYYIIQEVNLDTTIRTIRYPIK